MYYFTRRLLYRRYIPGYVRMIVYLLQKFQARRFGELKFKTDDRVRTLVFAIIQLPQHRRDTVNETVNVITVATSNYLKFLK